MSGDWDTVDPTVAAYRLRQQYAVPQDVCDELKSRLQRLSWQEVEIRALRQELEEYRAKEPKQGPIIPINNWTGD